MSKNSLLPLPNPLFDHHGPALSHAFHQWRESKKVPPVLLFTGPEGIGKRRIGFFLAQWLLCENNGIQETPQLGFFGSAGPSSATGMEKPCGDCAQCQRALSGNWVDFTEILPEEEGGALKIDQFRELKASQGFSAYEGSFRITLIPDAERMTVQAANSLLKLLEEPPPGWIFFLTASDPSLLLPTLVSRCQKLRLRPLLPPTIEALLALDEVPVTRRSVCAKLAQGSHRRALALSSEEAWEKRSQIFRFLEQPQAELNSLLDWAAAAPGNFDLLLDQLELVLKDLAQWSLDPSTTDWVNLDGKSSLSVHAARVRKKLGSTEAARSFWMERAERLFEVRAQSSAPLNRKLLIQDLLIPWTLA